MDPLSALWQTTANGIFIFPSQNIKVHPGYISILRFLGRLMAKSLLDGLFIEINLPPFIFRMLNNP
jgi:hypothetical protein